jgi:hypothetical protein
MKLQPSGTPITICGARGSSTAATYPTRGATSGAQVTVPAGTGASDVGMMPGSG